MKSFRSNGLLAAIAVIAISPVSSPGVETNQEPGLLWRDARELCVEGRGWTATKDSYDRLPARAEGVVRADVWNLSRHSAGISVRFVSDATTIAARWTNSVGEGTVDGTHPTDLGFLRMADAIEPTLRRALKAAR